MKPQRPTMSVDELARKIEALPLATQLQVATDLLAAGEVEVGIVIAERVVLMHQASKIFPKEGR